MGPGYFRHAQMSAVTPGRKLPPQHGQTPVSVSQSQHLGGKVERNPVSKVTGLLCYISTEPQPSSTLLAWPSSSTGLGSQPWVGEPALVFQPPFSEAFCFLFPVYSESGTPSTQVEHLLEYQRHLKIGVKVSSNVIWILIQVIGDIGGWGIERELTEADTHSPCAHRSSEPLV